MRDSLHIPMGEVTLSMFYVIRLCILHYDPPKSVLNWKVCYIYFLSRSDSYTAPKLYMYFYLCVCESYNGAFTDIFVYVIKSNCWIYSTLIFCSISLLCMGFYTTAPLLHLLLH